MYKSILICKHYRYYQYNSQYDILHYIQYTVYMSKSIL